MATEEELAQEVEEALVPVVHIYWCADYTRPVGNVMVMARCGAHVLLNKTVNWRSSPKPDNMCFECLL